MDQRITLPHEILIIIASYARISDVLSLLRTCRALNSDCGQYALSGTVRLVGDTQVISFVNFMHNRKRKRWHHLRSLCLGDEPVSPFVGEEFARAIRRATRLERLEFENAEEFLGSHADLVPAFAALKAVKHLEIECGYRHTCRLLASVRWPLETVRLHKSAYAGDWGDLDKLERLHPATLLQRSRSTLKSLALDSWSEHSGVLDTYPVYPEVHTLSFVNDWSPGSSQWSITYPNLKELTVHTVDAHITYAERGNLLDLRSRREGNLEANQHAGSWQHLEKFTGDVLDIYLLGLRCRILDMELGFHPKSVPFFGDALRDAQPNRLSLRINTSVLRLGSAGLPTCLQGPGLALLKHLKLDITIHLRLPEYVVSMEEYLDRLLLALGGCSVEDLVINIASETHITPYFDNPPGQCPVETWVNNVDLDLCSRRILEQVPSLQIVTLSVQQSRGIWRRCRLHKGRKDDEVAYHTSPVPRGSFDM